MAEIKNKKKKKQALPFIVGNKVYMWNNGGGIKLIEKMDKEREEKRKARRKRNREIRRCKIKEESNAWRKETWDIFSEMSHREKKEYRTTCKHRVDSLFDYIQKHMELIFHEANIDKLHELSSVIQELINSRAQNKEQLSPPWKKSGIHGLFVRDKNVKEVFEERFNYFFIKYAGTGSYRDGKRVKQKEVLFDISNLILDEEDESWYYIGIELFIVMHKERISRT